MIEPLTWLFPDATLLDDPHPPSDKCTTPPTIRRFAVVGARATIGPGVEVGEGALVGAASLVRADVPPGTVVVGVPAREIGPTSAVTCRHGNLDQLYPWWLHFRRGYPDGVLPDALAPAADEQEPAEEVQRRGHAHRAHDDREARHVGGAEERDHAEAREPGRRVPAHEQRATRARRARRRRRSRA